MHFFFLQGIPSAALVPIAMKTEPAGQPAIDPFRLSASGDYTDVLGVYLLGDPISLPGGQGRVVVAEVQ